MIPQATTDLLIPFQEYYIFKPDNSWNPLNKLHQALFAGMETKKKKLRDAKLGQQLQLINEPFTNFTSTNYLPYKFIAFHPLDSSQRPPRPGPQEWPREPGPIILYEDKNYPAYRPGQACGWDNNSYT